MLGAHNRLYAEVEEMKRETKELHGWRFSNVSALALEIEVLLRTTDLKLRVLVRSSQLEPLLSECENFKAMGRLEIRVP